jgi:hypothetical protein
VTVLLEPDAFDVTLPDSPYPGLRPFEKPEWAIFFGRERMVDQVVEGVIRHNLVVVHGDSGCGKSSLIRAGVLSRLEMEHARNGLIWRTCMTTPREAPLDRLAAALAGLSGRGGDAQATVEIRRALNFGQDAPQALVRLLRRSDSDHICVLIDQFEELFAFARRHGPDEPRQLVDVLVGLANDPPAGLYAVLTMRSEFLGACAQYPGLAEIVNATQYLLPRMSHMDLVRAIREPAPLYGGAVSPDLAERLIADAGGTQDQLPLIQHGLMMLHRQKTASLPADAPWRLDLRDLGPGGHLRQLLAAHADEVLAAAEPSGGQVAEMMLRALTEINADGQAIRRPQSFAALTAVSGGSADALAHVIDTFRSERASFLTPYGDTPITPATLIDISHEALIRSWPTIADRKVGWLTCEFQDGLIWRSLLVQAESYENNQSSVLSAATAEERATWLERKNAAWAERYGGGWDRVTRLVNESVDAGRAAAEAERLRTRRQIALVSTIAALLAAFLIVVVLQNKRILAASERASHAGAETLWNKLGDSNDDRLSNEELNALWEVIAGRPEVRAAFIAQLAKDPRRAMALSKHPEHVTRAIGLRWPPEQATAVFDKIVEGITSTTDREQLDELSTAALTVGRQLPPQAAQAATARIAAAMAGMPDVQVAALATSAQALAPHAADKEAELLLKAIVNAIPKATANDSLRRLSEAAVPFAKRVSAGQSPAWLSTVLNAALPLTRSTQITALREIAQALAQGVGAQQAPDAFATVITLAGKTTATAHTTMLTTTARTLVARMTPDQVRAELGRLIPRFATSPDIRLRSVLESLSARVGTAHALDVFTAALDSLPGAAETQAATLGLVAGKVATQLTGPQAEQASRALTARLDAAAPFLAAALASPCGTLAAKVPPAQAQAALPALLRAIRATTNSGQIGTMRVAIVAIAATMTAPEAAAALPPAIRAATTSTDVDQRNAMVAFSKALAGRLDAAHASTAIPLVVRALTNSGSDGPATALAPTFEILATHMGPEQAAATTARLLAAISSTTDRGTLEALETAAQAATARIAPDQAQNVFAGIISRIARSDDGDRLRALSAAALPLVSRVAPDRALSSFPQLIRAILATPAPDALEKIGEVARKLAARLPAGQAQEPLSLVTQAVMRTLDHDQLDELKEIVNTISERLTPAQAESLSPGLLRTIVDADDAEQRAALAAGMPFIATILTREHAKMLFRESILAIPRRTDTRSLLVLGGMAQALGPRLGQEQAQEVFAEIFKGMALPVVTPPGETRDTSNRTAAFGLAIQSIASSLTKEQCAGAADSVLSALTNAGVQTASISEESLAALASTATRLSASLQPQVASQHLAELVKAMASTTSTIRLQSLGRVAVALADRLDAAQAQQALSSVLIPLTSSRDGDQIDALGMTALALAAPVPGERSRAAVLTTLRAMGGDAKAREEFDRHIAAHEKDTTRVDEALLSLLAWSATTDEAATWAELLVSRARKSPPDRATPTLLTALKFPAAEGKATDVLLDGLQAIASAPGKGRGLDATLEWAQRAHAQTLAAMPGCPPAPAMGLTCPTVER